MKKLALIFIAMLLSGISFGACPSADLTDDCRVDLEDFAVLAFGWLTTYNYTDLVNMAIEFQTQGVPENAFKMAWITIDDSGAEMKDYDGNPISQDGFTGEISKYETTNAQYCQFLNSALASGDITVGTDNKVYGANGSNSGADFEGEIYFDTYAASSSSQITFDGSRFSVRTRHSTNNDNIDMSLHPVVMVSWYGATAFCNYYGYRLPSEWEWQAVADYDGSFTYGCGTTIDFTKANFYDNGFANPLNLSSYPYTTPVDHYPSCKYGINDMAGNAYEWTNSLYDPECIYRVFRGGSWDNDANYCTVSARYGGGPYYTYSRLGFRVCR